MLEFGREASTASDASEASRGINRGTISHTAHDLGIYIDSSINLADHVPRLTTRTLFFKFVNLDLSVRCSLSNFRTHVYYFSRLLQRPSWWKTMRSVSSVRYLASQKRTVPHWLDISAKIAFKIGELAHPCLHGSVPPYLIPYASERHPWTHIRTSQIGCGGHVKIS